MQFYSQHGEDEKLWEFFQGKPDGVCVEVGGFDGVTFSNSLAFEENGWRAIIVEPMPHFAERIRARRPKATLFACAAGARNGEIKLSIAKGEETLSTTVADPAHMKRIQEMGATVEEVMVPMRRLDDLLAEADVSAIDFITIDVEGAELEALAGIDLARWKPRVVILENALGKRSTALHDEMLRRGFHWLMNTDCNEWYVPATERDVVTASRRFSNGVRRAKLGVAIVVRNALEKSGLKGIEKRFKKRRQGTR